MTQPTIPAVNRRTVFAGAGAAGALAVVAAALPGGANTGPLVAAKTAESAAPAAVGGYQLTDHVKQYYATARI